MEGSNCCGGRVAGISIGAAFAVAIVYLLWSVQSAPPPIVRVALGKVPATKPVTTQPARVTRPISEDMLPLADLPWNQSRNVAEPAHLSGVSTANAPWAKGRKNISELSSPNAPLINSGRGNNYRFGSSEVTEARVPWSRATTRPSAANVDTARLPQEYQKSK